MSRPHHEREFQNDIVGHLAAHGWLRADDSAGYDKERALYPEDLLGWLAETDPANYARIVPTNGTAVERAQGERRILDRVAKRLATPEAQGGGMLHVLRKGFDLPGARRFSLLQMPPADDRNPNLTERYARNRLRVVQEVVYSRDKTDRIDLVLFCNGLPVATIELKTDLTQGIEHAKAQYRRDRLPTGEPLLTAGRGALVHFAVSTSEVAMTTRLAGAETVFLPFNQGDDGGAGNPAREDDVRTAYLWREILEREVWLTILSKFVYTNHERRTDPLTGRSVDKAQIRFPRYHQWRAVTRLVEAVRTEGPGHNYLIQHSAGSGKTDSIAWTAHRLASLHDEAGEKVFDTVFVLADRQVLDRQLQDAVDQLVTATGTFQAITSGSEGSKTAQLTEALAAGVPIIGVTLQTFPYALAALKKPENEARLAGRHFAVIADEAHSSQSGESAKAVKELLYLSEAPATDEIDLDEPGADQDALVAMAAHADQDKRLSFFAFTATPKAKTLELFGRPPAGDPDGTPEPFDLYSMKQAIEEGFILDVLANYTSYDLAARIALRAGAGAAADADAGGVGDIVHDHDEVDVRKGTSAYIGYVQLHETNVASKVKVILDHFSGVVSAQLGGRAKAMVVTSSRAAAVTYARAFSKAIAERGLPLRTLVAFSGEVEDPDVAALPGVPRPTVTEASMNPDLRGRDLAKVFAQPDQHLLIVANKYQTGFDQPMLVAMYVDKQLSGIAAVQTLSRLNRIAPGKRETYVLDFVNDPQQILAAFQLYYEDARLETSSDPDLVADLMGKLDAQAIYTEAEIDRVWQAWASVGSGLRRPHGRLAGPLSAAVDRFGHRWRAAVTAGDDEELNTLQDFRSTLGQYVKAYAFFSQILHFGDPRFEKFSVYADLLGRELRKFSHSEDDPDPVDVSDVVLTHYRLAKLREEDLQLTAGEGGLHGMTEAGMAKIREAERAPKADLIEKVNKYFGGLDVNDDSKIAFATSFTATVAEESGLGVQALNNTKGDFSNSPRLQRAVEDAVWRHDLSGNKLRKAAADMSARELVQMVLEFGLYEMLREQAG